MTVLRMANSGSNDPPPSSSHLPPRSWVPGATMVAVAGILGVISLALFCYAWGLNFQDEGWSSPDGQTPQVKHTPLVAAIVGTVISVLLFWWGFMRLTRSMR